MGEPGDSSCLVTCKKLWSKLQDVEVERKKSFVEEVGIKSKVLAIIKRQNVAIAGEKNNKQYSR